MLKQEIDNVCSIGLNFRIILREKCINIFNCKELFVFVYEDIKMDELMIKFIFKLNDVFKYLIVLKFIYKCWN